MRTVDLMGPKALTFLDYVGWLKTDEGEALLKVIYESRKKILEKYLWYHTVNKAQTHLSQPVHKHMFVRPDKPEKSDFIYGPDNLVKQSYLIHNLSSVYQKALHQYENWKPMFVGTWSESHRSYWFGSPEEKAIRIEKSRCKTLDDFIREATKQEIELFYHPEHEMI